jgi:hypothetical protein
MCEFREGSREERRERERSIVPLSWASLMRKKERERDDRVCSRGGVGWVCSE